MLCWQTRGTDNVSPPHFRWLFSFPGCGVAIQCVPNPVSYSVVSLKFCRNMMPETNLSNGRGTTKLKIPYLGRPPQFSSFYVKLLNFRLANKFGPNRGPKLRLETTQKIFGQKQSVLDPFLASWNVGNNMFWRKLLKKKFFGEIWWKNLTNYEFLGHKITTRLTESKHNHHHLFMLLFPSHTD